MQQDPLPKCKFIRNSIESTVSVLREKREEKQGCFPVGKPAKYIDSACPCAKLQPIVNVSRLYIMHSHVYRRVTSAALKPRIPGKQHD